MGAQEGQGEEVMEFPSGRYGLILADPPWNFKTFSPKGRKKTPDIHYPCEHIDDLSRMPVGFIAQDSAVLAMWATAPMMEKALYLMFRWGFEYKTMAAWAKQSKTGATWQFGTGYIFRSAAEFLLIGTCGKPKLGDRSTRNLIVAPVREHSRKPDIYNMLEKLFPCERRIELFAREKRDGWDAWGNEVGKYGTDQPVAGGPDPAAVEGSDTRPLPLIRQ